MITFNGVARYKYIYLNAPVRYIYLNAPVKYQLPLKIHVIITIRNYLKGLMCLVIKDTRTVFFKSDFKMQGYMDANKSKNIHCFDIISSPTYHEPLSFSD